MIVVDAVQRSDEWHAARLGIPTASNFKRIITGTGKVSTQLEDYMDELLTERLTGRREEIRVTEDMQYGIDNEANARAWYEYVSGNAVEEIGLCLHDTIRAGASPDGLVDTKDGKGCIEIKCHRKPKKIVTMRRKDKVPVEHIPQIQAQLWVLGPDYKFCDFVAWSHEVKPFRMRVERDDEYIEKLEYLVSEMALNLDALEERLC